MFSSVYLMIWSICVISVIGLTVSFMWAKRRRYCLTAAEYLSKHPKLNFIIHVFTGLGSGWLLILWAPRNLALVLGAILVVVAIIMRYVTPPEKLGMHVGLPLGLGIAWLSYPWMPKILTLILGTISFVAAETVHYVFPNLVAKNERAHRKASFGCHFS